MTVTTEDIQDYFKVKLYTQVDRHLLKRLSDDGFFNNDTITREGKTSLYPKDTLNHLSAYVLTSECLFNLGLISRVKKKNVCFAAAKSTAKYFNENFANKTEPAFIMNTFIEIVGKIVPRLTPDGKFYIVKDKRIFLFLEGVNGSTNEINNSQDNGVEERNLSIMFPKICVTYFFILSVLKGIFEDSFYENYKAFIEYITEQNSSPSGESLADFVSVNPAFTNFVNQNSLNTLINPILDNNLNDGIDDLLKLQNVLLLVNGISEPAQHKNIMALFSFIHIFDNQKAWLTTDILRPALIKLNPAFASHNSKTLRLAAEFLIVANSI